MIHKSGYVYNDLKLDNCVVGDMIEPLSSSECLVDIRIIDFGLAKKYVDKNGNHLEEEKTATFEGN